MGEPEQTPAGENEPTVVHSPGVDTRLALGRVREALIGTDAQPVSVGRYRILRRLGVGGMSVVYAAYDDELDREVAIKVLRSRIASAPALRQQILREALAMARLSHVNVAHVYEVGEHEGQQFVAMELIRGVDLRTWTAEHARTVPEILSIHLQAARGLAAAHRAGLVHRDFKPENVMVDENGWARVLDFGLVVACSEPATDVVRVEPGSGGSSSSIMGTPGYMAPEQLEGRAIDARADQYAFCATVYEALHRHKPGRGEPDGRVPEAVDEVLRRGLFQNPDDRWPSMDALVDALVLAQQQRELAERSELERKARALDFDTHTTVRGRHALVIGIALAAIAGTLYALRVLGIHEAGYPDAIVFGCLLLGLQLHSERRLHRDGVNEIDRRWSRMLTLASALVPTALAYGWLADLPFTTGLGIAFFVCGAAACVVTLLVDPRAMISGLCMILTALALVLLPEYRGVWLVLGLFTSYGSLTLVWRGGYPPKS